MKFCVENFPTSKVLNVEMFPRFMERCCLKQDHMSVDDTWVLDNNRREVEKEVRMKIEGACKIVRWY